MEAGEVIAFLHAWLVLLWEHFHRDRYDWTRDPSEARKALLSARGKHPP